MTEFFAQPDDLGEIKSSELHTSMGERLGAQFGEAFFGASRTLVRGREYADAESGQESLGSQIQRLQNGEDLNDVVSKPQPPAELPIADAKARVKQEGLEGRFKLPDQPTIKQPVLDLMIDHAHERQQYDAAVTRGPQGFIPGALGMATEIGAGIIDPVNVAAFSIPVMGEARMGMMIARAGESLAARAGVKAGIGAAQGAVGSAALVPGDWWLHTKDGVDYTMTDALHSIVMGAGMGGAFHAGIGAFGDLRARARGAPLAGSVLDLQVRALRGDAHAAELLTRMKVKPAVEGGGTGLTPEIGPANASEASPAREGLSDTEVPGISAAEPAAGSEAPPAGPSTFETHVTVNGETRSVRGAYDPAEIVAGLRPHPAEVLADLPPQAREDTLRASMADVINGNAVRAGELLEESAKADPRIAETIEAWHGSPHDFDRFDMSKIGSGEGAQAYGHGLYFAESPEVATGYREKLASKQSLMGGAPAGKAEIRHENGMWNVYVDGELQNGFGAKSDAERYANRGALYKVRINADREHFLDWDVRLDDQPAGRKLLKDMEPELRDALEERLEDAGFAGDLGEFTGNELHQLLLKHVRDDLELPGVKLTEEGNAKQEAAHYLLGKGVPGIKYLDQGSRQPLMRQELAAVETAIRNTEAEVVRVKAEITNNKSNSAMLPAFFETREAHIADLERKLASLHKQVETIGKYTENGTRNLVVFDHADVEITHKNGEPVSRGERHEILHGQQNNPDGGAVIPGPRAARGPRARDPETWSLAEFIAHRGGLDPTDPMIGDVRHSIGQANKFVPGFGNLIRKGGMKLDRAREAAVEAGYLHDNGDITGGQSETSVRTLLDAVDREMRGERVYRAGREPEGKGIDTDQQRHDVEREIHGAFEDSGIDAKAVPDKTMARVVEIMEREGERDPLQAYERAVMEETHYGAEAGQHERIPDHIPGWDLPADAGAAPAPSRPAEGLGRPGAGEATRDAGAGDRGAPGASGRDAGVKPDWQKLADARRAGDEDLAEASRAAEHAPEPESTAEPAKAVSAAERAAAEADKLLEDILPTLSEEERALFKEALDNLDHDRTQREQIVREGAACLLAATA